MPIAAVPAYLGNDFSHASPGLRFGMYLQVWTDRNDQESEVKKRAEAKSREGTEIKEILRSQGMDAAIQNLRQREKRRLPGLWDKNEFAARQAWKHIVALNGEHKENMQALLVRQSEVAKRVADEALCCLSARAIAPFTTGLGNEHPLENGFAFLNPYGLPYLPGSGVKGVLRQAARELASGEWGDGHGWSHAPYYSLKLDKATISLSVIDVLFGKESQDGDKEHVRGALSFWDVIPQIAGGSLAVEIMTPHQSHYYQQKAQLGSTTPHDCGQPNPISFLTVPPGSQFTFHVVCDLRQLKRLTANRLEGAPDLLAEGDTHWKKLLEAAFEHAFVWLGFGAKTAVGYGAMESMLKAKQQEAARQQAEAEVWPKARIKFNPANKALTAEKNGKIATAIAPKGEQLLASLPDDVRKKVETRQFVQATAYVIKNTLVRVEL